MTEVGNYIVGVDEAGRGPLAGPVAAAAVILDPNRPIAGLQDSKKLSAAKRESLFEQIQAKALSYHIAYASALEIDQINILQASLLAMRRAVEGLSLLPTKALIDGIHCPPLRCPAEAVVKGDQKYAEISAASILAKVSRDRMMLALDQQFPHYGFAQHKGYPTAAHFNALAKHGPCDQHRRSFAPVRKVIVQSV